MGTLVTWTFTADAGYPIERLMLNIMKGSLQTSFEKGFNNLKEYLEGNPPVLSVGLQTNLDFSGKKIRYSLINIICLFVQIILTQIV